MIPRIDFDTFTSDAIHGVRSYAGRILVIEWLGLQLTLAVGRGKPKAGLTVFQDFK